MPEGEPSVSRPLDLAPSWLLKSGVTGLCVLSVGAALWMVAEFAQKLTLVLVPVLLALLLAGVFEPLVDRGGRRLPGWVTPLVIVLVLLVATLGGVWILGQRIASEVPELTGDLNTGVQDVTNRLGVDVPSFFDGATQDKEARPGAAGGQGTGAGDGGAAFGGAADVVKLGTEIIFGFFLTLALAFLFMKDGKAMWRWALDKTGPELRPAIHDAGRAAWGTVGAYVRGLTAVALFDAAGIGLGLLVLGVPLVVTLAALQFVGSYIPTFGSLVAGGAAVLVAYVSGGLPTAALALAMIVIVQQIGNDVIEPWVMGRTVGLHPAAVLIAVGVGGVLWDVAGAFLFVPLAAAGSAASRVLWGRRTA